MATAETKTRELTYYKTVGTAAGPQLKLTQASTGPLEKAAEVLAIHAKDRANFPCAAGLRDLLVSYLVNPQQAVMETPAN